MTFSKAVYIGLINALILLSSASIAGQKLDKLVFSGPYSTISYPLIHMLETNALSDIAKGLEFIPVDNPDQTRLIALGKGHHRADFMAMPVNVAAILYNKGVKLKLINVSVWGILWMVSRDPNMKTLADFKNKNVAIPYRGDMPDIVFRHLAKAEGIDLKKDISLRYTAHPLEAMQLLLLGQVDHALLAEPAISMALQKNPLMMKKNNTSSLYRSVDLQQEWGRVFKREDKFPQLGIAAMPSVLNKPKVIQRFQEEYKKSTKWCQQHPVEAGKIAVKYLDKLTPKAVSDSLYWTNMDVKDAKEVQNELEHFYRHLMLDLPALVAGRLPDQDFYYLP
jgi:NitT/TauT family transport system substrate-binding protein